MGMGRPSSPDLHRSLVDKLVSFGLIRSPSVEAAFRAVPRHLFLPEEPLERAYADEAIPTKLLNGIAISSASQPAIVAVMLEQLELQPGHRVLEIGAGTGYNAALMAHIVGETGHVITLDIDEDIVASARNHLAAAGYERVQVVLTDGTHGYPEAAPYDRIVLTVAAADLYPAWSDQLTRGGRLLLPLRIRGDIQRVVAFEPRGDHLESVSVQEGGFMPLRGEAAWRPERLNAIDSSLQISLTVVDGPSLDAEDARRLLASPVRESSAGVRLKMRGEIWGSLDLWLALRDQRACVLYARDEAAAREDLPWLVGEPGKWSFTLGLIGRAGLALLTRPPDQLEAGAHDFEPLIRSYGAAADLAQRLVELLRSWDAAGRPSSATLRIKAYPRQGGCVPVPEEVTIEKPLTRLVLQWD